MQHDYLQESKQIKLLTPTQRSRVSVRAKLFANMLLSAAFPLI